MGKVNDFFRIISSPFDKELTTKCYALHTDKLFNNESVRIVLISDLHSQNDGVSQAELQSKIARQSPHIIALAGDIADAHKPLDGVRQFLHAIKELAPIYYVTGNHECRSSRIKEIRALLQGNHVNILSNTYEQITVNGVKLIIGGVDDPDIILQEKPNMDWEKQLFADFSVLSNQPQYKILLSHRPEMAKLYKKTPFDLVLSGHAHGGQVRIPYLLNGLFAPHQGLFPRYAGGVYQHGKMTHIVSRGASYNPRLPRIYNPPEIVVIDLFSR